MLFVKIIETMQLESVGKEGVLCFLLGVKRQRRVVAAVC